VKQKLIKGGEKVNYLNNIIKQKEKLSSVQVFSIPILLSYSKEKNKVEKKPVLKGWTNISSGEDLENYWDLCIDALEKFSSDYIGVGIGVLTGKKSNLTVIDIDNLDLFREKLGEDLTQKLFDEASVIVKTARGGYHFYFVYCEELKQGTYQNHGFDVRNDNGFVVAPPSQLIVSEKVFKWEWVKEDFENLKPISLDILQALSQAGAVKWEGEEEAKEEIYIEQEEILELASILRELWLRKYVTGYDIDTGFVGGLVRSNLNDEEIFQLVEEIFKEEFSHKRTQYMIDRARERLQKNIPFRSWGYLKALLNNLLKSEVEQEAKELAEKALKILSNKKKESRNSFILTLIRKYTERLKIHNVELFSRNDEFFISLVAEGKRGLAKVEMKLDDFNKRNKFINLFLRFTARKPNEIEPPFRFKKTKEGFKKVYLFPWEEFVSYILEKAKDIGERGEKEDKLESLIKLIREATIKEEFNENVFFVYHLDGRYFVYLPTLISTISLRDQFNYNLKDLVQDLYKLDCKPCRVFVNTVDKKRKRIRLWDVTSLIITSDEKINQESNQVATGQDSGHMAATNLATAQNMMNSVVEVHSGQDGQDNFTSESKEKESNQNFLGYPGHLEGSGSVMNSGFEEVWPGEKRWWPLPGHFENLDNSGKNGSSGQVEKNGGHYLATESTEDWKKIMLRLGWSDEKIREIEESINLATNEDVSFDFEEDEDELL
jgi:hypothetical protein